MGKLERPVIKFTFRHEHVYFRIPREAAIADWWIIWGQHVLSVCAHWTSVCS